MKHNNTLKTLSLFFLAFFFILLANGQSLHHQMLSAQGNTAKLKSGHFISQSIGQQSSTGSSLNKTHIVLQGFQQSAWNKLIVENILPNRQTVTVYPNPFVETINFDFGETIAGGIQLLFFDISGRLVAERNQIVSNNSLQLKLNFLAPGMYLVHLRHKELTYYAKISKK
jgi:hypothetical protein